ncbi:MAG: DNA ligase D [Archangium sp.]
MAQKRKPDSLKTYREKRNFDVTSEPSPDVDASPSDAPRFMIHKHDATRLHYDLRLEDHGALVSWACPKGPSYDLSQKRLAVQTEDHPLAYGEFEGRIPDGEYGAGDSIIWDRGTFETVPPNQFDTQFKKGHLHVALHGEKLDGEWHFVRTRQQGGKQQWLFFKAKDGKERADYDVVAERPESVKSGRRTTRGPETKKVLNGPHPDPDSLLEKIWPPMSATLAENRAAGEDEFVYEVKYDGYRAVTVISGSRIAAKTRNNIDLLERFPFLGEALNSVIVGEAVIDGEIIGLDEEGVSRFERLGGDAQRFVAFDLLWLDGKDLRSRPLEERRELLESLVAGTAIELAERVELPHDAALQRARDSGWEGLIAKRKGSLYEGKRSLDWLKLKVLGTAELAIVGYTPHSKSKTQVGALLLGSKKGDALHFAGKVGTGFDAKMRTQLLELLHADVVDKTRVIDAPRLRDARWVEPRHVAQLRFTEWTRDGRLRHPSFQGLREDKKPEETAREKPAKFGVWHSRKKDEAPVPAVKLTHPEKVMFPKSGFTKADVRAYYDMAAPLLVDALHGRALTMQQFPQGIEGQSFFRHAAASAPEWIERTTIHHEDRDVEHIVVNRVETVQWLANQSALTLHKMSSRFATAASPDWVAFDFDPPGDDWEALVPLAQALRGLLEELKLNGVPKTSGKRGLHVLVPLAPGHTHDDAHDFARDVVHVLAAQFPKLGTDLRVKKERQGRLYLDPEQNGRWKTMVAPYSIRAVEGAPVSTPLEWDEVHTALKPSDFNIKTMEQRLAKVGDLFAPALAGNGHLPKRR